MASVRIFSSVARLAVMVAIAPESKTICTVATSVTCDCTEEPTAVILRGSPSTRPSTMSMSWIIRSITTESFCTRGTKGPSRRDSMRMGRSTILRSSCTAPLKRSTWPTWSTRRCSRAIRKSSLASSSVGGHRLLDEHVDAGLEQVARDREVLLGGHRHGREVDLARELAVIAVGAGPVGGGHPLRLGEVGVHHPDQLHAPDLGQGQDVVLAHVPGADHRARILGSASWLTRSPSSHRFRPVVAAAARARERRPRLAVSTNSTRCATRGWWPSSARTRLTAEPGATPER